jgi:rSAM/selenodomain-associated transferase 1
MNKKALIIFAKQPVPGNVKTRLVPPLSPEQAARLCHFMLSDILNKTKSLESVDRFLFHGGDSQADSYFHEIFPPLSIFPQEGIDLGARMEAAFDRIFSMGYRTAAIIGTDSPDLPVSFIADAFRILEKDGTDVVFGPAEDGGYYLLGMKRIHGEIFHGIPWSTGQVLSKSLKHAESAGLGVATLPVWYDVDTIEDLQRPELRNQGNCAPLTRSFVEELGALCRGGS